MKLREAAQRVLAEYDNDSVGFKLFGALEDLRAALAEPVQEPVQEPVAWMIYTEGGTSAYVTDNPNDLVGAYRALALYTAPPQRKPLTDEEIRRIYDTHKASVPLYHAIARAIERAHGIE